MVYLNPLGLNKPDGLRKPGRPKGRKVTEALKSAETAATSILEMEETVSLMNPAQKIMFESVMSGDDSLVTALKSGHADWFTGITKKLSCEVSEERSEGYIYSSDVTLDNAPSLTRESYDRLIRICDSQLRKITGEEDYRAHTLPIREYIKRFAPLALGTVVDVMQHASKAEVRLKAANSLLDRGGEKEPEPEKDIVVPVQVNIMLTDKDGNVTIHK